jgi:CBS domain-containing protein
MRLREPITNVMSSKVTSVNVDEKFSAVRRVLLGASFHHVPIVKGRKLVGMVSTRDILRLSFDASGISEGAVDEALDKNFAIDQVMKRDLVTIDSDDSVETAIDLLARGKFHSLPVIDEDGCLIGIVTSIDVLAYLMA